jgi:hypothetical protein
MQHNLLFSLAPKLAPWEAWHLDLALSGKRKHHGMAHWIDIEADHSDELGGKAGIARSFAVRWRVPIKIVPKMR